MPAESTEIAWIALCDVLGVTLLILMNLLLPMAGDDGAAAEVIAQIPVELACVAASEGGGRVGRIPARLTVTASGKVYFEEKLVSPADLERVAPGQAIAVRVDARAPFERVVQVLSVLRRLGNREVLLDVRMDE